MFVLIGGVIKWITSGAPGLMAVGSTTMLAAAAIAAAVSPTVVIPMFLSVLSWLINWFITYFQANVGFVAPSTLAANPFVQLLISGVAELNIILPVKEAVLLGMFLIAAKFLAAAIVSIRRMVGVAADRGVIASNS